jgi:spermidine synthase
MTAIDSELMTKLTNGVFVENACSADTTSMYSLTDVYWAGRSPICDIVIAKSPVFGKVLFLDKEIQSAESDEAIYHEHLIHPIMNSLKTRQNKRVLVVGGGEGATCREVLKWNSVGHVDWVDIDGDLVGLCRTHLGWAPDSMYEDKKLIYYPQDIRTFLQNNDTLYDVIVLDLPDPDVDDLNSVPDTGDVLTCQLYSQTFMHLVKLHLAAGGGIVSHVGPISPGGDEKVRRAGLTWLRDASIAVGLGAGHSYHVTIPSFQGSWGFWMSVPPMSVVDLPDGLCVMEEITQALAFTWPSYWTRLGKIDESAGDEC